MQVKIIKDKISIEDLKNAAKAAGFDEMIKAAVDVEREIMVVGGDFHSDCSEILFEDGSKIENLWGINIYFNKDRKDDDWIEYNSLINIKPQNNRSMEVQNLIIKEKIKKIVDDLIQ